MRINQFVARAAGIGRRSADKLLADQRVTVNQLAASIGQQVGDEDIVSLDGRRLVLPPTISILFNKPLGVVCSRRGQGSKTIYDLLPSDLRALKTIGRLDKNSTGLIILTNDGDLIQELGHPSWQKNKVYEVKLNRQLKAADQQQLSTSGVVLSDGPSQLPLQLIDKPLNLWRVTLQAGRNRQIRRSFNALGYKIISLHRIQFGEYYLGQLGPGKFSKFIV